MRYGSIHGQRDHEEGRGEGDGVGVDQRHAREDIEEAEHAADADTDANRLQARPGAADGPETDGWSGVRVMPGRRSITIRHAEFVSTSLKKG